MVGATGFEPATTCTPSGAGSCTGITSAFQLFRNPSHQRVAGPSKDPKDPPPIRRDFATNLLPPIEQLLTVRQVAKLLGVCPATVYKWAANGMLPHVRIVNVVRVLAEDLIVFIAKRRSGR